jgi:membrane protein DedA with SNARE-associated domain
VALETIISSYGYLALVAGAFVEEATFVIMAGFLAHEGYFSLSGVTLVSFVSAFAGAQILFMLGRKNGTEWIDARPKMKQKLARARGFLSRNEALVILGFRFVYGLHTVAPVSMGLSSVSVRLFTCLNAASALIWAAVFSLSGYGFGRALNILLIDLRRLEKHVLAAIAVAGVAAWVIYRVVQRRKSRAEKAAG